MSVTLVVARISPANGALLAPEKLTFDQPRIVIGRGPHADVRLPSRAVSDTHAVIRSEAGDLSVIDEGSTNGTAVNGQPLVRGRRKVLRAGDRVSLPGFEITLEQSVTPPDPPGRTATVARRLLVEALSAAGSETAPPELVLTSGRRAGQTWRFPAAPSRLVAGRGEMCEIVLDDVDCSRQHAEFVRDEGGVLVRDLGSKNGVFFGERRVSERRLRHGDELQLGRSVLRFDDPTDELLRAFEGGADESALLAPRPSQPAEVSTPAPVADAVTVSPSPAPRASTPPTTQDTPIAAAASSPAGGRPKAPRPSGRTADWIVIALALVILAVSIAALFFLLRSTPTSPR